MAKTSRPGCRDTALAIILLVAMGAVFIGAGLSLIRRDGCIGLCETLALGLLYAGGPISGLFGVLFGGIVLAWPLDATLWVGAGFLATRIAERRGSRAVAVALVMVMVALAYGLVLSNFVELAVG